MLAGAAKAGTTFKPCPLLSPAKQRTLQDELGAIEVALVDFLGLRHGPERIDVQIILHLRVQDPSFALIE